MRFARSGTHPLGTAPHARQRTGRLGAVHGPGGRLRRRGELLGRLGDIVQASLTEASFGTFLTAESKLSPRAVELSGERSGHPERGLDLVPVVLDLRGTARQRGPAEARVACCVARGARASAPLPASYVPFDRRPEPVVRAGEDDREPGPAARANRRPGRSGGGELKTKDGCCDLFGRRASTAFDREELAGPPQIRLAVSRPRLPKPVATSGLASRADHSAAIAA